MSLSFRMELLNIKTEMYHDRNILQNTTMFYETKYKAKLDNWKWRIDLLVSEPNDDVLALQLAVYSAWEAYKALASKDAYQLWKERMRDSGDPCTLTNPLIRFNPENVKAFHKGRLYTV
jgi:hypothetical protein